MALQSEGRHSITDLFFSIRCRLSNRSPGLLQNLLNIILNWKIVYGSKLVSGIDNCPRLERV